MFIFRLIHYCDLRIHWISLLHWAIRTNHLLRSVKLSVLLKACKLLHQWLTIPDTEPKVPYTIKVCYCESKFKELFLADANLPAQWPCKA